ncbi:MAG TPA: HAD family hydrolase [Gemmatimonadaceae bacterium]|nr:HAD family hydrolase [Gemmatimonadaceae bacterium]
MNPLPSAVFLDRDGTIMEDVRYVSNADDVKLIVGAAEAIARVNSALVPIVVITNQSGIGRGYYSEEDYHRVEKRTEELLAERGAKIDATYFCPHSPADGCECRKPGTLLFERAAADLRIDLSKAVFIGDRLRDIEPALQFGGAMVLVPNATTPAAEIERAKTIARVADSLAIALDWYVCTN